MNPSVHELASSGANLVVSAVVNFTGAENCPFLTARNILCTSNLKEGGTISGDRAYTVFSYGGQRLCKGNGR